MKVYLILLVIISISKVLSAEDINERLENEKAFARWISLAEKIPENPSHEDMMKLALGFRKLGMPSI